MRLIKATAFCAAVLAASSSAGALAGCNSLLSPEIDTSRYQALPGGAVEDQTTGLQWQRCPVGFAWSSERCAEIEGEPATFTWQEALGIAVAKGDGWRLPNSKELESLIRRDCYDPAIEVAVFSDLTLGLVWSSTPASAYFGNAWAVQFRDGGVVSVDKEGKHSVRLVRDGR